MPNVASFENTPKSKKKKRKKKLKGKNLPAATPADDDGESTESDDPHPQPPVPPKTSKVSWSNEQVAKYLMLNTYLQSQGAASAASAEIELLSNS